MKKSDRKKGKVWEKKEGRRKDYTLFTLHSVSHCLFFVSFFIFVLSNFRKLGNGLKILVYSGPKVSFISVPSLFWVDKKNLVGIH